MLRKTKALSAFAAALLASASVIQPAAAQTADTWNLQGGYDDNAPYSNDPYSGGAYDAPRDLQPELEYGDETYGQGAYGDRSYDPNNPQTSSAGADYYYGAANDENYERERAAQAWRAKYQSGYAPPANPGTSARAYPGSYAQADQDYYARPDYGYDRRDDYYSDADYYAYRRACERQRANNQVGGLIFGAIAGGLFGNAVSHRHSRGSATAMGMIMGGALGAGIAGNMDCGDHYYYRRTYYDGFQRGYPNRTYRWHNPNSGHHGDFRVGDYYDGPAGERCATYAQTIWVRGRPERASGYACRRGDGSWEIVR
jgi:surface antigen